MKRFFTKTGIWLLGGAAVIAVVLCIISAMGSGTSFLHNALGVIASPFRAAGSAVVNWVDGISDHFASVEELQAENEALRQENAQLRQELQSAQPAAQENQRLRKLLDLREQRSDLKFEAARVTQRDVSNWASTLVLDRGSQHGVAIGDCAVDSAGNLVGVVTDVGLNWCRLSTVLDTDSQFGARVFRTGETAVAGGDLALMSEGRLRLQYLSDSANLIKGDVIVTSGLGGYYPAGLVIGTVESVQTDDGGLARYAVLSPKCDVAAIQEMFIITDFDVIQ
jgi:rod shape-determining protein MreC